MNVGLEYVLVALTCNKVLAAFLVNLSCFFIKDNSTSSPKWVLLKEPTE
jgi:hypothetical protein